MGSHLVTLSKLPLPTRGHDCVYTRAMYFGITNQMHVGSYA